MTDINNFTVTGRIAGETKLSTTRNGTAILSFCVAVNRDKKVNDEWVSAAGFFWFSVYGNRATGLHPYLRKGVPVGISGHIEQEIWQEGDKKNYRTVLCAEEIALLGTASAKPEQPQVQSGASSEMTSATYDGSMAAASETGFSNEYAGPAETEQTTFTGQNNFDNDGLF